MHFMINVYPARSSHPRWAAECSAHSAVPTLDAWRLGKLDDQENHRKISIFGYPNRKKSSFAEALGASLGSLGASWAVVARLGRVLGVHLVHLGASEGVLEASWGHLGASGGDLGRVLGSLGGFLEASWE